MALRSRWAKLLPMIGIVTALFGLFVGRGVASSTKIPACTAKQLRTVAYGTGLATGTEYFAVAITNKSETENLVILKHFGPGNPDAKGLKK